MNNKLKNYSQKLVNLPCNLCQSKNTEFLFKETRFNSGIPVVICKKCGLIYLNPRWSDKTYARFYENDYRKVVGVHYKNAQELDYLQRIRGSNILAFCSDFIKKGSRVLDIGSGPGGILWIFKEFKNCKVFGLEPSEDESEYARNKLKINTKTSVFETVKYPKNYFDLIMITRTLNHLYDPAGSIGKIWRLLKPNGKLFIEVQNFIEFNKVIIDSTQIDHIYYFVPETLECMLKQIGFIPIRIDIDTIKKIPPYMRQKSTYAHIRILAQKTKPQPIKIYPDYQLIQKQVLSQRWKSKILKLIINIRNIFIKQ